MSSTMNTEHPCSNTTDLEKLETLIENSFTHDWILGVEYTDEATPKTTSWKLYGEAMFAVRNAEPVMDSIAACREKYPGHHIRLNAEKLKPRTRMLYCVYRAPENLPETTARPEITPLTDGSMRTASRNALQAMRSRVSRMASLAGILFASLFLIEEAMT